MSMYKLLLPGPRSHSLRCSTPPGTRQGRRRHHRRSGAPRRHHRRRHSPSPRISGSTNQRKPILYPLIAPDGITLTRGNPPLPGERTDHPHHAGLWFNYSNVNDIDFWNNSDAIKPDARANYGSIDHDRIVSSKSGTDLRRTRHRVHLVSLLRRPHRRQQPPSRRSSTRPRATSSPKPPSPASRSRPST